MSAELPTILDLDADGYEELQARDWLAEQGGKLDLQALHNHIPEGTTDEI